MDDHETEHDASGPVEAEESEAVPESGEQTEEGVYISVRIRLAQYEALSQYDLTAEEAIDEYRKYRQQEEYDLAEYETLWPGDDDDSQDDVPEVDAA